MSSNNKLKLAQVLISQYYQFQAHSLINLWQIVKHERKVHQVID